jgi:hypothetical protein
MAGSHRFAQLRKRRAKSIRAPSSEIVSLVPISANEH